MTNTSGPVYCVAVPWARCIVWRSGVRLDRKAAEAMAFALTTLAAMGASSFPWVPDPQAELDELLKAMAAMGWRTPKP